MLMLLNSCPNRCCVVICREPLIGRIISIIHNYNGVRNQGAGRRLVTNRETVDDFTGLMTSLRRSVSGHWPAVTTRRTRNKFLL